MTSNNDNEIDLLLGRMKSAAAPIRDVLRDLHARILTNDDGAVATYIPELAKANPRAFGITIATVDGQVFEVGDCNELFSIQSISKPFVYGLAVEDHGVEGVLAKVGVEPTGEAFNAIVLDEQSNRPFNPMVNAGAIATADLIKGKDLPERISRILRMFANYSGREVYVDNAVFMSERLTGHRNRAIGWLMRNFDMITPAFEESLELYFQQCSILVNTRDLAIMGATLANGGLNPFCGQRAVEQSTVKYILSVMLSCGMYDYAGEWAYRVGIPSKSGVAGGIVGVIPGQFGIGVYSPRLDSKGNSVRGVQAFRELSERFNLHILDNSLGASTIQSQFAPQRGARS